MPRTLALPCTAMDETCIHCIFRNACVSCHNLCMNMTNPWYKWLFHANDRTAGALRNVDVSGFGYRLHSALCFTCTHTSLVVAAVYFILDDEINRNVGMTILVK